jgi:hypothetical protein
VIITNKHELPEVFVNMVKLDGYSKGKADISATEMLNSPRIVQLRKKHFDEIEIDVADNYYSIVGTAIHHVLEKGRGENDISEERLFVNLQGWVISGAIDMQIVHADGSVTIQDYKTTGVWGVMNEKIDWEYQLNIYAWLVEKVKGVPVRNLQIVALIRDWSRRDSQTKEGYPQAPIKIIPINLWPFEDRETFILNHIKEHSNSKLDYELYGTLPECTPEQMWEKPTTYAVMKEGNKRATSVHDTEAEAQEALKTVKGVVNIVIRPGERSRCENYCSVNKFCNQYQKYLEEKQ